MRLMYLVIILILLISFSLNAENSDQNYIKGFRASLQSKQFGFSFPFIKHNIEIAPNLSVVFANEIGTDFGVGISFRKYKSIMKVAPFYGIGIGVLTFIPKEEDAVTDFIVGLCTGAEYFVERNLSIGVELQLNGSFSDEYSSRFGNPGEFNINTASAVFVSVYW